MWKRLREMIARLLRASPKQSPARTPDGTAENDDYLRDLHRRTEQIRASVTGVQIYLDAMEESQYGSVRRPQQKQRRRQSSRERAREHPYRGL